MQNLTQVVYIKSRNSRDNDEKSESYIVFHYGFCEFVVFCFVLLNSE